MKALSKEHLIPYEEYERQREAFRRRLIALKARRRLSVGDKVTILFENRDTLQFQVQEMIRAERIVDPVKVQKELDVYNALLPGPGELSATLFIEVTESADVKRDLDAFQGIDRGRTVWLVADTERVEGTFEGGHSKEDKISAVHFVRFRPSPRFINVLQQGTPLVSLRVDHSNYRAEAVVPQEMQQEWLTDLTGE
ncbi:MAG: DUF3501 family protein [Nitrospiraceae bacterium]